MAAAAFVFIKCEHEFTPLILWNGLHRPPTPRRKKFAMLLHRRTFALALAALMSAAAITLTPVQPAHAQPSSSLCAQYYTVGRGDTLTRIARRYGLSVAAVQRINGIAPNAYIYPGQILCLVPPPPASDVDSPGLAYTVMRGDTLNRIARQFGVSVNALMAANAIRNPNRIEVGQVLIVPIP